MFLFGEFVLLMRAQTTCGSHKTMQDGVTTKAYQQWGGDLNFMVFLNSYGHADVQPAVNAALTAVHNNRASVPWPSGAALEACVCQSRWTFENVVHAGCTSAPTPQQQQQQQQHGGDDCSSNAAPSVNPQTWCFTTAECSTSTPTPLGNNFWSKCARHQPCTTCKKQRGLRLLKDNA